MKNLRTYLPIISIFGLALLIRIIYNLTVARHYIPEYDAELYNTLAKNLVTDHCFCYVPYHPITNRAPLWPFIMSVIYLSQGLRISMRAFFSAFSVQRPVCLCTSLQKIYLVNALL